MLEQSNVADETREFLQRWGLKGKFVAATCYIPEQIFSRFVRKLQVQVGHPAVEKLVPS